MGLLAGAMVLSNTDECLTDVDQPKMFTVYPRKEAWMLIGKMGIF